MAKKYEPIPIEAYKCPRCKEIIRDSYKAAQRHVNISLDNPLPKGLVVKDEEGYFVVQDKGKITYSHQFSHWASFYYSSLDEVKRYHVGRVASKDAKRDLKKGKFSLLSKQELRNFREGLSRGKEPKCVKRFVRKNKELEDIVM